jgi:hypothetical protein
VVEHFLGKEEVTGSNPVMSSRTPAVLKKPDHEIAKEREE